MTVPSEAHYRELLWTGAETSFSPGFAAESRSHVRLSYLDANDVPVALTLDVHFTVALDTTSNVTVTPIAMPAASPGAPVTLLFERLTPALQGVQFLNLNTYDPDVHETLFDRAFRTLAELRGKIARAFVPTVTDAFIDFRPRRVKAADPVDAEDLATKSWVEAITGLTDILQYVAQAAASAAASAASAALALVRQTAAEAARDLAQLWASQSENTPVTVGPDKFSAFHWAQKAAASAALVLVELSQTDDGLWGDVETDPVDDGIF